MKILFLSLLEIHSLEEHGLYSDLLRQFVTLGHFVRIVSPEPGCETRDEQREQYAILHVSTPPMQKTGMIRKGIAALQIGPRIRRALDRFCSQETYDLILMATPPVTLAGVVEHIRQRDGAKFYLMLKDIWPQGIADLGVITQNGWIYRYFRAKERRLYRLADYIGCMSPANVEYVCRHNPSIPPERVGLCPNSIEPNWEPISQAERNAIRMEYQIPLATTVFLYGGNLGKAQDIPFLIQCLRTCSGRKDCFFVICGSGTAYGALQVFMVAERPDNVRLISGLPREAYERLAGACDIGMIFLDHRFTIPNFPSRLLSYLEKGMPVLCATDAATDVGHIAEEQHFGWCCSSGEIASFQAAVERALKEDRNAMGMAGRAYLEQHYNAQNVCRDILTAVERIG